MDQPLVSVLMPVYNSEKFLRESMYSVINQTYENLEILAINDGSTDGSKEILEEFTAHDKRVRIINKKNGGIVSALNKGIAEAKGKYLARIDADDVNFLDRIEIQVSAIEKNDAAVIVCSSFEVIDDNGVFMYHEIIPSRSDDIKRIILAVNPICHSSALMRKSTVQKLGGYDENSLHVEDYDLWTRMAEMGDIIGISRPLVRFRVNPDGITQTQNTTMIEAAEKVRDKYFDQAGFNILARRDLIEVKQFYQKTESKYSLAIKKKIYNNTARSAWNLRLHNRRKDFWKQILALASVDRTGFKIARSSFVYAIKNKLSGNDKG